MTTVKNILNVYITNLNLYNAGLLFGEWVDMTAPAEEITEVIEKISRSGQDEIFITDFEGTIKVDEFENIEALKNFIDEITEALEGYTSEEIEAIITAVCTHTNYRNEQLEIIKNNQFYIYADCDTMAAVAYQILCSDGTWQALPEIAKTYFDLEAYGYNLDIEGKFYSTSNNMFVEIF